MILYLDTSALVKRYFQETYSNEIISQWKSASQIITSFVAYAETIASIYRKKREADLSDKLIKNIIASFHRDWDSFIRVEVNNALNDHIHHAVERYRLRGFDAIHLASAAIIRERITGDYLFACFDDRLVHAARSEGIITFP